MGKIKLVFFDMDGVIFDNGLTDSYGHTGRSVWTVLAKHLGKKAYEEEEQTKRTWTEGKYDNYMHWVVDTIRIHKKYRLDKKFFFKVINSVPYFNGVKETMKELKDSGIKIVIMTGGFKELADRAQMDFGIDHSFAACEYFWDKKGKLKQWNVLPSDYEGKIDFMELMIREFGLNKQECAFVGDGRNDIPLAKEVEFSICFNGPKELQEVCKHSIKQPRGKEDLRAVLRFLQ